ncbi:MAG: bifunctional oligoribonuclease/PAP phosphatase NrnA, partial [Candidatus Electrothrix sp. AR4]|nr:bifunctional oligoribonuclease/PAP phosphatase NrnA [Candidatus Electrothrix sp. AR4]
MSKTTTRQAIEGVQNIVLATHVRPDGDALGSMFALADILKMMGKKVVCYLEQPVTGLYSFLRPEVTIEIDYDKVSAFIERCGTDIIGIALDCGDLTRLGDKGPELNKIKPFLVIDHHQGNKGFGDLHWVEPHRSSTGEMIYDLAEELGVAEKISKEAAECLYAAIVTDTGSFHYDSTSAHTFNVAGKLINLGVNPAYVCQMLFDNATFGSLQLMQLVIATLQTYMNDQVAIIHVSQTNPNT